METVNVNTSISDINALYTGLNQDNKKLLLQKLLDESKSWTQTDSKLTEVENKIVEAKNEKKEEILLASPDEMKDLIKQSKYLDDEWKAKICTLIDKKEPYVTREQELEEEILKENSDRFVILPLRFIDVWIMYKLHEACFWVMEEVSFTEDMKDWQSLNDNERYFIKKILAFFSSSDGIIGENIVARFYQDVQIPEAKSFYAFQLAMEHTHSFTYSVMIDTYVKTEEERLRLFGAIHHDPAVRKKAQWALKFIHDKCASFAERLFAIACVEGIFFSGSFCAIFWLKKRGLMPGLTYSNELISRDESLHMEFAILLYSLLKYKLTQEQIEGIVRWCVAVEHEFVTDALPVELLGMNSTLMRQYICFVADRLLAMANYKKIWNAENPFEFMEMISLQGKTNFFEKRVAEYQKSSVLAKTAEMIKKLIEQYGKNNVSMFVKKFVDANSNANDTVKDRDPNAFTFDVDF